MSVNQRKAGVILSYLGQGIQILSALVYTPIMLRLLGQSEYGLYQLVHSVVSYLSLFSLGFTAAYVRFYSRFKSEDKQEDIYRLNGMFLSLFMIIALIASLCGVVMIGNIRAIFKTGLTEDEYGIARVLMAFMIFNLAVSFPNSVFNCIISAHEQFFFQRVLTVLHHLLNPFITLPLLLMGYGSIGMVVVTTVITLAQLAANILFTFKKLHEKFYFNHFDYKLFRSIGSFTFFIFLNQIIDQINWSIDKFLLGRMINTAAVAIYGLGAQINTIYVQLSSSISSVFVPQVNQIVANRDDNHELSELFTKIGRIQFFIMGLILSGFIFVGKPFMLLWGGKGYTDSYYVTLLLIIPVTVPLIQNIGIEIQRAKNMHKARSVVYAAIAIANIFLSIPLIRMYGPIGAAVGTAISLFVGNGLFMNWYYDRKIGLEIGNFWRNILSFLPALILPAVIGICIMQFVPIRSWLMLVLAAIIYAVIYFVSFWVFGFNAYEKSTISGLVRKIGHKFVHKRES